jgi:hypothetical protein
MAKGLARFLAGSDRTGLAALRDLALSTPCSEKLRIRSHDLLQFAPEDRPNGMHDGPSRRPIRRRVSPRRMGATRSATPSRGAAHTRGASSQRCARAPASGVYVRSRYGPGPRGRCARVARASWAIFCVLPDAAQLSLIPRFDENVPFASWRVQRSITTCRYSHGTTNELCLRLWRAASSEMSLASRSWPAASSAAKALCVGP